MHNESIATILLSLFKPIAYSALHARQYRQNDPPLFTARRQNSIFRARPKGRTYRPAVAERVRRLEEMEVITGYHATINYAAVGFPISAVMEVTYPSSHAQRMYSLAGKLPEVIECCHLTGNSSVVLRVVARSIQHLETLMKAVQSVGTTQTSVILSTPVSKRVFSVG